MPPKKKKTAKVVKKAAVKKSIKKTVPKKAAPKKAAPELEPEKEAVRSTTAKPDIPCICIETRDGWFCMKQLPNGELKECDGPFDTKEECERHTCT